ncbi:hypothetical protein J6590_092572 [Homalodisca vitripennis]|nr:hypothetical protein J6590_092572 [Homalodisca vitripennis]
MQLDRILQNKVKILERHISRLHLDGVMFLSIIEIIYGRYALVCNSTAFCRTSMSVIGSSRLGFLQVIASGSWNVADPGHLITLGLRDLVLREHLSLARSFASVRPLAPLPTSSC